jgi:hypothetical protein
MVAPPKNFTQRGNSPEKSRGIFVVPGFISQIKDIYGSIKIMLLDHRLKPKE